PRPGEIWRQPDLLATLEKLVEAEARALDAGKDRKQAIYAAYARFYTGDIAEEYCRGSREQGGLHTLEDLAHWQVKLEEPLMTTYKGIEVYKLSCWTQGPVMLQALNLLEHLDLQPMGYDSARYIHALYQVMNLAYADRDFYYGDIYFPPQEPIRGLLSKDDAKQRLKLIDWNKNNPDIRPGDPYPFEGKHNPFLNFLTNWSNTPMNPPLIPPESGTAQSRRLRGSPPSERQGVGPSSLGSDAWANQDDLDAAFRAGTTSIQAADDKGWAISVTPSGGWQPAYIAGHTGIGMSQRMQSF